MRVLMTLLVAVFCTTLILGCGGGKKSEANKNPVFDKPITEQPKEVRPPAMQDVN